VQESALKNGTSDRLMQVTGFLKKVLQSGWAGNLPQEVLAKFGYRFERTLKENKDSCYVLVTCWSLELVI
jgi:hypothetical protein